MSGEATFAMPCEPCMLSRMFPKQAPKHECTGLAALSDGSVPCPCCRPKLPPSCGRCHRLIGAGEEFEVQLAQSASGGAGATNFSHKACPEPSLGASPDVEEGAES